MIINTFWRKGFSSSIRKGFAVSLFLTFTITITLAQEPPASTQFAKGIVYWDKNNNGQFDKTERGIENVAVSNGKDIVQTDKSGRYSIPADDDCVIFIIKPAQWISPLDNDNFPKFYYINKPAGSPAGLKFPGIKPTGPLPEQINFPLYPHKESSQEKMILLGDVQVRNFMETGYFGKGFVPELNNSDASFVCTLGDNAFNDLSVYPALKDTMGAIGKPIFFLPGNHDENYDVPDDNHTTETYKSFFGPNYYSFNWGQWHIVMLDDINYQGKGESYKAGLGKKQLDYLQSDLKRIKSSGKVILMSHIPLDNLPEKEKVIVFNELSRFQNKFIISGHTHRQNYEYFTAKDGWIGKKPLFHLNEGTACGSFWSGIPDEFGIPLSLMVDGTPKGYAVVTLSDGYQVSYKIPNRPADYQMNIYLPNTISAAELTKTEVAVNIFTGSKRTKVAMRIDGKEPWLPMEKRLEKDPGVIRNMELEKSLNSDFFRRNKKLYENYDWISNCHHLWKAALPANLTPGAHTLEVISSENQVKHHGKTVFWVK
jgi:calcineurin-like phosphoesterase family protein